MFTSPEGVLTSILWFSDHVASVDAPTKDRPVVSTHQLLNEVDSNDDDDDDEEEEDVAQANSEGEVNTTETVDGELNSPGEVEVDEEKKKKKKKLTNQFNFTDRGTQTYNNKLRDKTTSTEPPPTLDFSGNVSQWIIYDAYQDDFENNHNNKTTNKKSSSHKEVKVAKSQLNETIEDSGEVSLRSAKIIERMVSQNMFDEAVMDFKYYEDLSDEFRDPKGTLLPLWSFRHEKLKNLNVTSVCWSETNFDLFAASFGSYDFEDQGAGAIAYFSLKNPAHPEHFFLTECGVMTLDVHPKHPQLLAVGLHDGNIAVFDFTKNLHKNDPVFQSDAKSGRHSDIVWQVKWQEEDYNNDLNFYSISADGRVLCWTILKNEMNSRVIVQLTLDVPDHLSKNSVPLLLNGSGTTFDFHPSDDQLYLVGTEEGKIHVCSKNQSGRYLNAYHAHFGPVYKVVWNLYHPSVFASCSYDWMIKIWDRSINYKEPLLVFDVGSPVSDVAWAPYSSTVLAAVTLSGKVFVFDLNVNKYECLCDQQVGKRKNSRLTQVAFNSKHPVILVGNERGTVKSFKLSPNLRKMPKEKKNQQENQLKPEERESIRRQGELEKMEKILEMVRPFQAGEGSK